MIHLLQYAVLTGNYAYSLPAYSPRRLGKGSPLARAPLVQNPTVPFSRPPGTAITGRHRNGGSRRRRGRSIEVAGHCIGRTDPLLDHPCHLDDPRRVTTRAHTSSPGDTMVDGLAGRSLTAHAHLGTPRRRPAGFSSAGPPTTTDPRGSTVDSITSIMDCPPARHPGDLSDASLVGCTHDKRAS